MVAYANCLAVEAYGNKWNALSYSDTDRIVLYIFIHRCEEYNF